MRRYGSRREDNDIGQAGGVPVAVHGAKSSRARAKREAAQEWIDCHGQPSHVGQLARLLEHVETRAIRDVARWLRTLAKHGTQPADYYEEAARRLDEGYVPVPMRREAARELATKGKR